MKRFSIVSFTKRFMLEQTDSTQVGSWKNTMNFSKLNIDGGDELGYDPVLIRRQLQEEQDKELNQLLLEEEKKPPLGAIKKSKKESEAELEKLRKYVEKLQMQQT